MKLLPLILLMCWMAWGVYLGTGIWNLGIYYVLPTLCSFTVWFICRKLDKKKESLLSCIKPFAIVFVAVFVFVSGVALHALIFGTKTPSVEIEVEEVLSYLDYADRPIIEIKEEGASLEVTVYTNLFQMGKDRNSQSTIVIIEE